MQWLNLIELGVIALSIKCLEIMELGVGGLGSTVISIERPCFI